MVPDKNEDGIQNFVNKTYKFYFVPPFSIKEGEHVLGFRDWKLFMEMTSHFTF